MYDQHMSPMDSMRNYPHGGAWRGGYGEHKSDFMEELSDWAYGRKPIPEEFKAVVCAVMKHQTDIMLEQYGYTQQGGSDPGRHHQYKEALEELRDVPNVADAVKRAPQYFDNLTEEDKKVLMQILNRPSYKKMAQSVNMTPERFMEIKRGLEYKLKN